MIIEQLEVIVDESLGAVYILNFELKSITQQQITYKLPILAFILDCFWIYRLRKSIVPEV